MTTLEEMLGIDPDSPAALRAAALVEADGYYLRNLVAIRKMRNLTQADVARILGISQPTVASFEAYDSNPTLSSIRRYAHAVEALVAHHVEADQGQLLDPQLRSAWVPARVTVQVSLPISAHQVVAASWIASTSEGARFLQAQASARLDFALAA